MLMSVRPLAFLAAWALAVPALAQAQERPLRVVADEDWCNDEYSDHDRSRTCTVFEAAWAGGSPVSVDARPNGGVHVQGWDRNEVRLRAKVVTRADDEAEARRIASQVRIATGPVVRAQGPEQERGRSWWVSYRLDVPRTAALKLESMNGGIHIAGVEGELDFTTVNGGLHLKDVGGRVTGRTTNGGVHLDLGGSEWRGEGLDLTTTNGGVHVSVPRSYNARLEAATTNGRVHGDIAGSASDEEEAEEEGVHGRHWKRRARKTVDLVLGSGGPLLRIRTTNGGVHVNQE
jgi:hypothetical protein